MKAFWKSKMINIQLLNLVYIALKLFHIIKSCPLEHNWSWQKISKFKKSKKSYIIWPSSPLINGKFASLILVIIQNFDKIRFKQERYLKKVTLKYLWGNLCLHNVWLKFGSYKCTKKNLAKIPKEFFVRCRRSYWLKISNLTFVVEDLE